MSNSTIFSVSSNFTMATLLFLDVKLTPNNQSFERFDVGMKLRNGSGLNGPISSLVFTRCRALVGNQSRMIPALYSANGN